ncbi:LysR family transcriptional regulator [Rhodococcus sp. NPDC057529]|uniref:LysR family transcriptional regulator n=1 Tax=Rhodococcus sp. NPDC057529 TaxID=3346158 RepID=UPI00366F174F
MFASVQERQLKHFLAIVEAGSISGGAAQLGVTQPGLSQSISALERDLGVALFRRSSRHTALTPAGREFVDTARKVVHDLARTRSILLQVTRNEAGTLRVACPSSLAVDPLTYLFGAFRRRYPQVWLEMRAVSDGSVGVELVQDGSADLALDFAARPPQGMCATALGERRLLAVLPRDNEEDAPRIVSIRTLLDHGLVTSRRGGASRSALEALAGADTVAHSIAVEVDHEEAVLPLVLGGAGAAVLPDRQALLARDTLGLRVGRLDPPITQPIALFGPADHGGASASAFTEIAREAVSAHIEAEPEHG